MSWIRNMSLGKKLVGSFAIVAGLALILSCFGIFHFNRISNEYSHLYNNYGMATGNIGEIGMVFNDMRANLQAALTEKTPDGMSKITESLKDNDRRGFAALDKVESKINSEEGRKQFTQVKTNIGAYLVARDKVIKLCQEGKFDEAAASMKVEAVPLGIQIKTELDNMYTIAEKGGSKVLEQCNEEAKQTMMFILIVSVGVVFVALLFGALIARSVSKPVNELMSAADKIAAGDLDVSVDIKSKDEIGKLAASFSKMATNVSNAMHNINAASEQVAAGAKNVSDASISLSQGATEQASSVEQLSSSIEEIASQTKLNAENADHANTLTDAAQSSASEGNSHMQEMLNAMTEINGSSANISKIIKVIDEIAFQTNILALNAAVEAARAGQHGKGFAVVAEEVRNLAARSAKAAKETTDMIEGSIEKVNGGTKIAHQTAEALSVIVSNVTEVASLVANIAKASNEQNVALAQINQGVIQVSQVVQSNSATSEQAAAASEELSAQAELLKQTVQQFKLARDTAVQPMFGASSAPYQDLKHYEKKAKEFGVQKGPRPPRIALSDDEFGKY